MKLNVDTVSKITVTIIVFLATLHSYYFYQIGLAPFPIVAFLILLVKFKNLSKNGIILMLFLYAIFALNATVGILYAGSSYYFNSLLGILIGPLFFILFIERYITKKELMIYGLKAALIIHLVAFYIQFTLFYTTGFKIDYLTIITGEESRVEGFGVITDLIRSSGLFNEPASYSLYVSFFSIILLSFDKKFTLVTLLGFLSCFLSLSVGGIVYALFGLVYYFIFINRSLKRLVTSILALITFFGYLTYLYYDLIKLYFESRFVNADEDVSSDVRFKEGFDYFFSQPFYKQLTGLGIGNYPPGNISTIASGFMAIVVHLGYLFTALYILTSCFVFINYKYKLIYVLIFLVFLTSTITYLNIHYWLFLAVLGILSQKYRTTNNQVLK